MTSLGWHWRRLYMNTIMFQEEISSSYTARTFSNEEYCCVQDKRKRTAKEARVTDFPPVNQLNLYMQVWCRMTTGTPRCQKIFIRIMSLNETACTSAQSRPLCHHCYHNIDEMDALGSPRSNHMHWRANTVNMNRACTTRESGHFLLTKDVFVGYVTWVSLLK